VNFKQRKIYPNSTLVLLRTRTFTLESTKTTIGAYRIYSNVSRGL